MKRKPFKKYEYCPHCRRVTEHLIDEDEKLCKNCGRKHKIFKTAHIFMDGMIGHNKISAHERKENWREEIREHL